MRTTVSCMETKVQFREKAQTGGRVKGIMGEVFNVQREVSGRVSRGRLCGKGVLGRFRGETTDEENDIWVGMILRSLQCRLTGVDTFRGRTLCSPASLGARG